MQARIDPLQPIEEDLRALIKDRGLLERKLRDSESAREEEAKETMLKFLAAGDAFENLFRIIEPKLGSADEQARKWVGNFKTVHKILTNAFASLGVAPIESLLGAEADPNWHTIVETVPKDGKSDGVIVEEIKRGYLYKGKLLRPAEVVTVKNA